MFAHVYSAINTEHIYVYRTQFQMYRDIIKVNIFKEEEFCAFCVCVCGCR